MAEDSDDTVRIPRPQPRPAQGHGLARTVAALLGAALICALGVGVWMLIPAETPPAPPPTVMAAPAPVPEPPQVAPVMTQPIVATETEILARAPDAVEAYRFALQRDIVVLQFATLAEQASTLNRAAAMLEKAGFPRDRVLDDAELDRLIRAGGGLPETFYFGHDYRAADLLRFFQAAARAGVALTPQETWLRDVLDGWGWRAGTNAALISLVRDNRAAGIDKASRATILRHELSHGLYFVDPTYAAYAKRFWDDSMTEAERAKFRAFLAKEGYDATQEDLMVNETQAYLMHTADDRYFNAAAVGIPPVRLDLLRVLFLTGMPPGWLRDCTVLPGQTPGAPPTAAPARPAPRRRISASQSCAPDARKRTRGPRRARPCPTRPEDRADRRPACPGLSAAR